VYLYLIVLSISVGKKTTMIYKWRLETSSSLSNRASLRNRQRWWFWSQYTFCCLIFNWSV